MEMCWGVDVWIHSFLTSVLYGDCWSAARPFRFTLGKIAPGIQRTPDCLDA